MHLTEENVMNLKRWEIAAGLGLAGHSFAGIARELGCSKTLISNVALGKVKSKRVMDYIKLKAKKVKIIILDD